MDLRKVTDAKTCSVTPAQAAGIAALCAWLRQSGSNEAPPDPFVVVNGLNAIIQVAQQTGRQDSAPGWKATHLAQIVTGSDMLTLHSPGGDELVLHLDATGKPYSATWSDVPGGFSENCLIITIKFKDSGWQFGLDSLGGERLYNFDAVTMPAWGQRPAGQIAAPAVPENQTAPTCARCAAPLTPGEKFCGKCGAPVTTAPSPTTTCSQCGALLTPGKKFCGTCGAAQTAPTIAAPVVAPTHCPRCGAAMIPGKKFCAACGMQVN